MSPDVLSSKGFIMALMVHMVSGAAGAFFNTIANRMVAAVDAVGAKGAECMANMANLNIIYESKKATSFKTVLRLV